MGKNSDRIVYDPIYEQTDENIFEVVVRDLYEWKYSYPDYHEMMPRHMSEELGKYVVIKNYVDANHAGNMENRRLHSGIIIHINNEPIIWYSKLKNTVETSSFGSEFVALRISTYMIEFLSYKLICF